LRACLGKHAATFGKTAEHRFAVDRVGFGSDDHEVEVNLGGGLAQVPTRGLQLFHRSARAQTCVNEAAGGVDVLSELQPNEVDTAGASRQPTPGLKEIGPGAVGDRRSWTRSGAGRHPVDRCRWAAQPPQRAAQAPPKPAKEIHPESDRRRDREHQHRNEDDKQLPYTGHQASCGLLRGGGLEIAAALLATLVRASLAGHGMESSSAMPTSRDEARTNR
jgi:hypothetical protein